MPEDGSRGLSRTVSENLRKIRDLRGLSLEGLAELTGVSRSMINQIERGASSPTLATLYKITSALKISLSELTARAKPQVEVVDISAIEPIVGEEGFFQAWLLQPFSGERGFEMFYCEQKAGSRHLAEAHQPGTEEYLTLSRGCLSVEIAGQSHILARPGSMLSFKADVAHEYISRGDEDAAFALLILYNRRV